MLTAGWMVYALATGALVAIACRAVDGLARAHRVPTRGIWAAGLGVLLLLAARSLVAASAARPAAALLVPTSTGATQATPAGWSAGRLLDVARVALDVALARATHVLPAWNARVMSLAWLLASLVALLVMTLVHLRIGRARRRWPAAQLHGQPVHVAPATGPAVLGIARPFIVVPRWLLGRSGEEQRIVLAHEREHLLARDHLLLAGATAAVALVPWHPAAWWMWARLRLAIELDCDARVLRRGVATHAYGALLIDLAGQCSGYTAGATALADETSHLERRLLAMTTKTSRFTRLRAGALLAIGGAALLAACEAKVPTSADVANMDVASAEKSASQVNLVDGLSSANTTYFVDGAQVDAASAHALPRTRIASIQVKRTNGASEMRITTLPNGASSAEHTPIPVEVMTTVVRGDSTKTGQVIMEHHGPAGASAGPFNGVIYIDGVKADNAKLQALDPRSIVSMEVIKGPRAAQESSDPAAANGIIRVTTKAGAQK